jgi:hypothetical protein
VALGLGPDDVQRLSAPMDEGGAGLSLEEARAWSEVASLHMSTGAEIVSRVVAWRRIGVPAGAPVMRLASVLLERDPEEVRPWLESGFTAEDVAAWEAVDLPRATRWRAAGFGARQARELVLADPNVTPEEARSFDDAGIEPARRVRWVAAGFSAAEAREWTDVDVVASEARVWRSLGLGPADARAQGAAVGRWHLPVGFESGWAATGPDRDDMSFGVNDPPGTRGSVAAEQAMASWAVPGAGPPDFLEPGPEAGLAP